MLYFDSQNYFTLTLCNALRAKYRVRCGACGLTVFVDNLADRLAVKSISESFKKPFLLAPVK
jgi:hypothetical protein